MAISVGNAIAQKQERENQERIRLQQEQAARAVEKQRIIENWVKFFDREIPMHLDLATNEAIVNCGMNPHEHGYLKDVLDQYTDEWDVQIITNKDEFDGDYTTWHVKVKFKAKI